MKVRIFGHLDFYAPSGQLGLKMVDLDPRFTLGDLAQQRDQVLRRLAADGSLDANRRHRLGPVPLRLGVVASPGTAAWHDFHDELQRSGFGFHVVLAGTRVQGPDAPRLVSRAVTALANHARRYGLDAIVLIRGGGARNELATFDAEAIARAIVACPVPVLTGLGHEIDRSVADEVAHTSLKTPTACAAALVHEVGAYVTAVERAFVAVGTAARTTLNRNEAALIERSHRIAGRTHAAVERAGERLGGRVHRLRSGAHRPIVESSRQLDLLTARLARRVPQVLGAEDRHLAGIEARVRALDPVNVLARGWTITRSAAGTIVRSADDVDGGRRDPHPVRRRVGAQPGRGLPGRRTRPKGAAVTPEPADLAGRRSAGLRPGARRARSDPARAGRQRRRRRPAGRPGRPRLRVDRRLPAAHRCGEDAHRRGDRRPRRRRR